jgi:hypothetical protein
MICYKKRGKVNSYLQNKNITFFKISGISPFQGVNLPDLRYILPSCFKVKKIYPCKTQHYFFLFSAVFHHTMRNSIIPLLILTCILRITVVVAQKEILQIPVPQPPDVLLVDQSTIYYAVGQHVYQVDVFQESNGTWISSTRVPIGFGLNNEVAIAGALYLY